MDKEEIHLAFDFNLFSFKTFKLAIGYNFVVLRNQSTFRS